MVKALVLTEDGISLKKLVRDVEMAMIVQALERSETVSEAARMLGLLRTTLIMKMQKYKIVCYPGAKVVHSIS